jgi:hypothetical protein
MPVDFSLIYPDGRVQVQAEIEAGRVRIAPERIGETLGWQLRDEGLCRGEACVPVRDPDALVDERGIDLETLAEVLGVPLALDSEACAAAVGTAHSDRANSLATLVAPDFSLPDAAGRLHTLSEHRGKKVLLIAYASW